MRSPPSRQGGRGLDRYVLLGLLPWPLVGWALFGVHSYWVAFLLYHGLCLAAWAGERDRPALLGVGQTWLPRATRWALLTIPVTLLVMGHLVDLAHVARVLTSLGFRHDKLTALNVYFLTVNPLAEEAFWRGTIYRGLCRSGHERRAAVVSSLLFAAWHNLVLIQVGGWLCIPGTLAVAAFGYYLTGFCRTHRLLPTAVFHSLVGDVPVVILWSMALAHA